MHSKLGSIYDNHLIYGKDSTENVVSIEVQDGIVEKFIQQTDGSVKSFIEPNNYWFLSTKNVDNKFERLDGNREFKWLVEIDKKENFYNTIKYCDRKNAETHVTWNFKDQYLLKSGVTYYKGLKPKDVTVLSFDIETNGLAKNDESQVFLITNTLRKGGKIEKVLFNLEDYNDEQDVMIEDWCDWVREYADPSIMLGHNILMYDIPYMQHCMALYDKELILGRDNSTIEMKKKSSKIRKDGSQSYDYHNFLIYGRELVDTMFLSLKYDIGRKFESYALKQIIKQLGMEKQGRTFVDASKIGQYYKNRKQDPGPWNNTVTYGIEDSDDGLKLFDLMVPSFFYQAQSIPMSFQNMINKATGTQINSFMIRSYLQENGSIPKASNIYAFEGAISFGIPGLYKNCVRWDVSSLYPSIMRQYKVYNKIKDPKAYFLQFIEFFTLDRLKNKKLYQETQNNDYKDLSESGKQLANSGYGFLAAQGLNFNSLEHADFITRKGREILSIAVKWACGKTAEELYKEKNHIKNIDNNDDESEEED